MTGATQASCRNKWLSVLLWDLKGLRGKRIAQNMGTKIGLIKLIYFVIFCAGCPPPSDKIICAASSHLAPL